MSGLRKTLEAATPGPWVVSDAEHDMGREWRHVYMPADDVEVLWQTPADARLIALAPELAALVLDMGEALDRYYSFAPHMAGCGFSANYDEDCDCGRDELDVLHDALLARLDQIGKEQT
jgi:hypothetical protein